MTGGQNKNIFGACLGQKKNVWVMFGACLGKHKQMFGVCLGYVWGIIVTFNFSKFSKFEKSFF